MTDEQFKQLMEKLEAIERELKAGQWTPLFKPAPTYIPAWPPHDHTGAPWPRMPQVTD